MQLLVSLVTMAKLDHVVSWFSNLFSSLIYHHLLPARTGLSAGVIPVVNTLPCTRVVHGLVERKSRSPAPHLAQM